jgi:hypothetical protein
VGKPSCELDEASKDEEPGRKVGAEPSKVGTVGIRSEHRTWGVEMPRQTCKKCVQLSVRGPTGRGAATLEVLCSVAANWMRLTQFKVEG